MVRHGDGSGPLTADGQRGGSPGGTGIPLLTRIGVALAALPFWLYVTGALWFGHLPIGPARPVVAIAFALGLPALWLLRPHLRAATVVVFLIVCDVTAIHLLLIRPSNDRNWEPDLKELAVGEIAGDRLTIRNVRNTEYRSDHDFTVRYEDRTYDLAELDSLDYLVVPFQEFAPAAHTMVSFGFGGRDWLAFSIEIRREKGEEYAIFPGFYRHFELIMIPGDERDLVGVRANIRGDTVYAYPADATPPMMRKLLLAMVARMNDLRERPEFYDTFTNSCTSNIVDQVNRIAPEQVPFSVKTLFPSYSDSLALDLGLLDVDDLPIEELRERYRVNEAAERYAGAPDFSRRIREGRPR